METKSINIELEGSPVAMFRIFGSGSIGDGSTVEIPGGARLTIRALSPERRTAHAVTTVIHLILTVADDINAVGIGVADAWLYDRIKKHVSKVRIEEIEIEQVTPEALSRTISRKIEID